jgi:octopine/nopaline transport system permease protein
VPPGAVEAGRVAGMSGALLYRRIILPLAVRQALPAYGNEIVVMVKSTALASMVTLMEVTGIAYRIISETYRALEVFICAGAIYLVLTFLIGRAVWLLERWLTPHHRALS